LPTVARALLFPFLQCNIDNDSILIPGNSQAIPQITDDFHSLEDVGWYGSAFMLTTCAFQLMFGKLYTFFSVKAIFMATVVVFEAGSALCGAAPNSVAFIIGRAIAGVGSAGIFSGVVSCICPPVLARNGY
jgi:MFS family permease